jgi:hypothetical protein
MHTAALPDSRTLPRTLPDSRIQPHCGTLLHDLKTAHRTPHCTLHTAHSRSPQSTIIKMIVCKCIIALT